jgi:hypothetical protein
MENTELLMVPEQSQVPLPLRVGNQSSDKKAFIEANTIEMSYEEMNNRHIIPVFSSNNQPLISHTEFINILWDSANKLFPGEVILPPEIRVSHPVKGRIPEAKNKPANQLEPWEETLYFERMMFLVEVPTIMEDVNGNMLSLTIGGVKAYNNDNLYAKRAIHDQTFKMFIGFKNRVCCNMCVWSDGFVEEANIRSLNQLKMSAQHMISSYNTEMHLRLMKGMGEYQLSESEFAQVLGRTRMYRYLPDKEKKDIPPILLGDQQISTVAKDYYKDPNFSKQKGGNLSLWRLYNLLTGANKATYIDQFLERAVNAHDFTDLIAQHKAGHGDFWYLR